MSEKNIIIGDDLERSIFESLGTLARMLLEVHSDTVLQIDTETHEEVTGKNILNRSIRIAQWFRNNDIKPGDIVSVSSENRIEFSLVPVAGYFVGATFAPFNPEYTADELNHVVNLSKPKVIFCSEKTIDVFLQMLPRFPYVKKIILFGKKRINHPILVMFNDILKGVNDDDPIDETFEVAEINPDEAIATILCSSGTTGLPKGVMTTHTNMTYFMEVGRAVVTELVDDSRKRVTLGLTPFFHSMGFMSMFVNMLAGNTIIVMRKFNSKTFLSILEKYKVTNLIVPPPVILFIIKHNSGDYDLSSLKDIRTGAAPMSKEMETEVKKKLNLHHASQGYGMTETTLGVLLTRADSPRVGSVGQIVPGMMAKVIDERGTPLGPYQEGELCFKGPLVMKGYVGDEKSTKIAIDEDNWLHTGDVAYYDNDGYFFIVDRIKELIKYKAYQVAPAELEGMLLAHPAIADAAVVGLPDEEAGELPLAFVVKRKGANITAKEIQDFIAGKVSPQKKLRGGVIFIDSIPKNPTGKILRRVLKEKVKKMKSKL
ncbi:long-chain-fatty-acid--coa ligase [Holotrichia oblita]|uniref:Long-chain-fatty-acid--coa ligase n=1 Tax=Holotrichia oblita TaxID=644536 RepID=A0ACB9SVF4_HOLOL|nr:long-chain-fatty-acid--coa ligase [Holotrichia oblita]